MNMQNTLNCKIFFNIPSNAVLNIPNKKIWTKLVNIVWIKKYGMPILLLEQRPLLNPNLIVLHIGKNHINPKGFIIWMKASQKKNSFSPNLLIKV
jgi:hypothetical protein